MDHQDHINLIENGIHNTSGIWADLGSGQGAFTMALADLLDHKGIIYSIDNDRGALRKQAKQMQKHFPATKIKYLPADFSQPLDLPKLDGIVMANSLHFILDKAPVLTHIATYLKPEGRLILVEYDTNNGNRWVPYPMTFSAWEQLATQVGFASTELLMKRPSSFLGAFFSSVSITPSQAEPEANT